MVTIKDFAKDDIVYVLTMNRGTNTDSTIIESTVATVGRKYVTLNGMFQRKYKNWESEYLFEEVNCGESTLLFKSKQATEEYIEKKNLELWLGCITVGSAAKYSLAQLQKVKEILG